MRGIGQELNKSSPYILITVARFVAYLVCLALWTTDMVM